MPNKNNSRLMIGLGCLLFLCLIGFLAYPKTSGPSKEECQSYQSKYDNMDHPETRRELNAPGSPIRKNCRDLGVVINQ
jgi:hypothetical protein